MSILSISDFGGGIAVLGSSDNRRTNELLACDGYDIGLRGELVVGSDLTAFGDIKTSGGGAVLSPLYGLESIGAAVPVLVGVGDALGQTFISVFTLPSGAINGGVSVVAGVPAGALATFASFPYVDPNGVQKRVVLVNVGARFAFTPVSHAGLYALQYDPAGGTFSTLPISDFDSLGTGPGGELLAAKGTPGTNAKQLYGRIVIAYNNFAFLFGNDNHATANHDAPTRAMFSNLGNPLKWGNDPDAEKVAEDPTQETDRPFTDSDAFTIAGAGEVVKAACVWDSKLWCGTNKGLHYINGFGRESFLTNGALPVRRTRSVVGPHAMIEGPDGILYGVADNVGLWGFDGATADPIGLKLFRRGKSTGYWDLIWTNTSGTLNAVPGQTNQDFVWMLSDPVNHQVWTVIPYCSIANGFGPGSDSVIIKYHTQTGGFTRQQFPGQILLHGTVFNREQTAIARTFVATPGNVRNISTYGDRGATGTDTPAMPVTLPDVTVGEYAPHGPDGTGVMRKIYLTLSWDAGALPMSFSITPAVDQENLTAQSLAIGVTQPPTPADGDTWVDTSGTDTNLGNGTAGTIIPSHPGDYLVKRWSATRAKWDYVPAGGMQGTRISVPIAFTPLRGTRVSARINCTLAAGRYSVEGVGFEPATIRSDR